MRVLTHNYNTEPSQHSTAHDPLTISSNIGTNAMDIRTKNLNIQTELEEDTHPIIGYPRFPILPRHMKPRCENCAKVVSKKSLLKHISHRKKCKEF